MKKLTKYKTITVYCTCGEPLVRYKKGPGRALVKIHRDRITEDYQSIFSSTNEPEGTDIYCVACRERVATVRIVGGKYLYKVNRGKLGIIRKS